MNRTVHERGRVRSEAASDQKQRPTRNRGTIRTGTMAAIRNRQAGTARPTAALAAVAALACGYTAGSVLHWGSPPHPGEGSAHTLADLMGDFGLSAVAAFAAVS